MSHIKERIFGAITVMSEDDAKILWNTIQNYFLNKEWDCIESIQPDEIDIQMLQEIESNPECSEFISDQELRKTLNL